MTRGAASAVGGTDALSVLLQVDHLTEAAKLPYGCAWRQQHSCTSVSQARRHAGSLWEKLAFLTAADHVLQLQGVPAYFPTAAHRCDAPS